MSSTSKGGGTGASAAGVGGRVRDKRHSKGLTGQALAVAAKVSIDTVRSIESGRVPNPGILTVAKLAAVLKTSLDDLAGLKPPTGEA